MTASNAATKQSAPPTVAQAQAAVEAVTAEIEKGSARMEELEGLVKSLGEQLDTVLAADEVDHKRAEDLENKKRAADRELEHTRGRLRGLLRNETLEKAEAVLRTAKGFAETEEMAEKIRRHNAGVEKVEQWFADTVKLYETVELLDADWANERVDKMRAVWIDDGIEIPHARRITKAQPDGFRRAVHRMLGWYWKG